jgi:hypothetical protein
VGEPSRKARGKQEGADESVSLTVLQVKGFSLEHADSHTSLRQGAAAVLREMVYAGAEVVHFLG